MRLAVISDLHLGDGGPTDRFAHDDGEFLGFLQRLESNFERVVLLGDIFETLSPRSFGSPAAELAAARAAHPEISRRLQRPTYTYLYGNHDFVAARRMGAVGEWVLEADGVRLLFTHGHRFDGFWRRARRLHERCAWLVGWFMRVGLRPTVKRLDTLDNLFSGMGRTPEDRCTFQAEALQAAALRRADVVVTGHTHVGGCFPHGDRLVLNSGSCSWGRHAFLEIDTRASSYKLHTGA